MQPNLLKAELAKKRKTITWLAEQFGITPQAMSTRINSGNFKVKDAQKVIELLEIENPVEIFLRSN